MYYKVYSTLQTLKTNCICLLLHVLSSSWQSSPLPPTFQLHLEGHQLPLPVSPQIRFKVSELYFYVFFYPSPTVRLEVSTSWKYRNHNIPKTLWCLCLQQLGCTWRVYCCHFLMEGAVKQGHHVRMPLHSTLCSESQKQPAEFTSYITQCTAYSFEPFYIQLSKGVEIVDK